MEKVAAGWKPCLQSEVVLSLLLVSKSLRQVRPRRDFTRPQTAYRATAENGRMNKAQIQQRMSRYCSDSFKRATDLTMQFSFTVIP